MHNVENRKKALKTTLFLVDNSVDDVDSLVNMHKTGRNNYAHVYMTLAMESDRVLHAHLERISESSRTASRSDGSIDFDSRNAARRDKKSPEAYARARKGVSRVEAQESDSGFCRWEGLPASACAGGYSGKGWPASARPASRSARFFWMLR